jgi:hypothetical protein
MIGSKQESAALTGDYSNFANKGLVAALPLSLSARPKRKP